MSHVSKVAEASRTATETGLSGIGRSIADRAVRKIGYGDLVQEAAIRRMMEQQGGSRSAQFAALVRQIGDAANANKPTAALVDKLVELRQGELNGTASSL